MWELNRIVAAINRAAGTPAARTEETPSGIKANVGHHYWTSDCGGFRLMKVTSRNFQSEELFSAATAEYLYKSCYAYFLGISAK